MKNIVELHAELAPAIAAMTTASFVDAAREHQVPMAPVNTLEQFFDDAQAKHNRTFQVLEDEEFGRIRTAGFFAAFEETPLSLDRRPPKLGEHTDEVLREAGLSDEEISKLRQSGAVS